MTYFISFYLHVQYHGESAQEAQNIDEEPLPEDPVAAQKTSDEPLPSIDPILPITGKYLINYI